MHTLPNRLFPCSSSPHYTGSIPGSPVMTHRLPPWVEFFENKDSITFRSVTPAPNRTWYTVYAQQMMWGWAELYMRRDTRDVEINILVQIYILTDRSSVLKRLDYVTLWREINSKMLWAGYSLLCSTKKFCNLFEVTNNVGVWMECWAARWWQCHLLIPVYLQTGLGQSQPPSQCFFHITQKIDLSAYILQAAFQAHIEKKKNLQMRKTEIAQVI